MLVMTYIVLPVGTSKHPSVGGFTGFRAIRCADLSVERHTVTRLLSINRFTTPVGTARCTIARTLTNEQKKSSCYFHCILLFLFLFLPACLARLLCLSGSAAVVVGLVAEEQRHPDGHMMRFIPAPLLKQVRGGRIPQPCLSAAVLHLLSDAFALQYLNLLGLMGCELSVSEFHWLSGILPPSFFCTPA